MKIICIGRNYVEHIEELNNEVPQEAVIFLKPDTAIISSKQAFYIPDFSKEIHHEVEVVVRIDRVGKNILSKFAHKYYSQISVGIDFTARDVQEKLKKQGLPWEKAKGFDGSAVIGEWLDKEQFEDLQNLDFSLKVNGEVKQSANTSQMMRSIDEIISEASKYFTLKVGDLIYTGTPKGVGAVYANDILEGFLGNQKLFKLEVY